MTRISRRLLCATVACAAPVGALGRLPQGGKLRLLVPWGLSRIDPHVLDDPVAALFGAALFDPLFALDAQGRSYPALAAAHPEPTARGARLRLRPGLVTARGSALSAADIAWSLDRARRRAALALLDGVPAAVRDRRDPLALEFPGADPQRLATLLASPLLALVPQKFSPLEPDGTGAFLATLQQGRLLLTRNPNAARGPALLERTEIGTAADLAETLRAFEADRVDVGWLGSGLHRPRAGALPFRGTHYGWAVLRVGKSVGPWAAPGVAQQLLDGIDPERLRHIGLEGLPASATSNARWGGGATELSVLSDAPQLVLTARTLAAALGHAGHEIGVAAVSLDELNRRRNTGDFGLMVDFVRTIGQKGALTLHALLAAQNPELAKKPPQLGDFAARSIGRSLAIGVIGELWAAGSHTTDVRGLAGWQLGTVYRERSAVP